MKAELPRPVSIVYRRPPRTPDLFPGILRNVTRRSLIIQCQLSVATPRQVAGQIIAATGYYAIWFIFKDKWFDVGKFYDTSKKWLGYYCDIIKPVKRMISGSKTSILTDLFLDIWIASDGSVHVLDEDELENAIRHGFVSKSLGARAHSQIEALLRRIRRDDFPPAEVKEATLLEFN